MPWHALALRIAHLRAPAYTPLSFHREGLCMPRARHFPRTYRRLSCSHAGLPPWGRAPCQSCGSQYGRLRICRLAHSIIRYRSEQQYSRHSDLLHLNMHDCTIYPMPAFTSIFLRWTMGCKLRGARVGCVEPMLVVGPSAPHCSLSNVQVTAHPKSALGAFQ